MHRTTIPVLVWALCLGTSVQADEAVRPVPVNAAPRFTHSDPSGDAQAAPAGFLAQATELQSRFWLSRGGADLGIGFGALTYGLRPRGGTPGSVLTDPYSGIAAASVVTIGMRYRTSDRSVLYADASDVRAPWVDRGDAVVGKVGFELHSTQSRLNISYGGLGLKFASDAGMTVRLRRGGLALFMRRSF